MIDALRGLVVDCAIVFGGAVLLALLLRFGRTVLDAVPMSRERRTLVVRLRPLAAVVLVAMYGVIATAWVVEARELREWFAFTVVVGIVAAASWNAIRDGLEGVYVRVGRTFAVGDRVEIAGIRGRVQKLGTRSIVIETREGELAIIPYRTVAAATIRREPFDERSTFHTFRVVIPPKLSTSEARRAVHEAAVLCHWSSTRRAPQVTATEDGALDITVFPVDPDHASEIERVVRSAVAE